MKFGSIYIFFKKGYMKRLKGGMGNVKSRYLWLRIFIDFLI